MKEFVEVVIDFKKFDGKIVLRSGEFSGVDPWGDDIYNYDWK